MNYPNLKMNHDEYLDSKPLSFLEMTIITSKKYQKLRKLIYVLELHHS